MKRYILATLGITRAYLKRFFRDKVALFFTFLFPLIFLFVFGSIFNNSEVSFKIALVNESQSQFAEGFVKSAEGDKAFKIDKNITDLDTAKQKMSRGEIDSVIVLPKSFGEAGTNGVPAGTMDVYYKKGSEQSGQTVAAVMQQVLDGINKDLGRPDAALKVEQKATQDTGLSQFDYTFSGLIGFTMLSMGIFGLANSMPQEKKSGAFRRLRASPFRASQLIIGNGIHYLIVTLLSVLAMIVVGLLVFKFNMRGDWLTFAAYVTISAIMMLGFGLLIGGWAKNENQSAPVSNLISFPMMFLSGVFFPRFLFPEWLQGITTYIPLSPVVDGLRRIMTEHASLLDLGPELGMIGLWTLAVYALAIVLFRWE